jgi:hypothetical protein
MTKQTLKKIPYGVANYGLFPEENYYYVDKTPYISKIEEKGRFLFLIRPRRFGKSLFLSLMESYYDINKKDRFGQLFQETAIGKDPTSEKNSYYVLKFNFSAVDSDLTQVEAAFTQQLFHELPCPTTAYRPQRTHRLPKTPAFDYYRQKRRGQDQW